MRLATIGGRLTLVLSAAADRVVDVHNASGGLLPADPLAALARWDELALWAAGVGVDDAHPPQEPFGPPVPCPRQVFAIALNYRPHAVEAGFQAPAAPLVFAKFSSCIAGPDVEVALPDDAKVDWEIEVVAVIGRGGFRIPREQAWGAVAGLTVGQDLSERVLQLAGTPPQFSLGKSYPGFGPIGPVLVTADEFPNADDVGFESRLGAEVLQYGRTSEMIFDVPELVARLSAVCPLYPGDLIFTGTPAGVGNRRTPPRYLQPGETLVSSVEHIGEIRQHFV